MSVLIVESKYPPKIYPYRRRSDSGYENDCPRSNGQPKQKLFQRNREAPNSKANCGDLLIKNGKFPADCSHGYTTSTTSVYTSTMQDSAYLPYLNSTTRYQVKVRLKSGTEEIKDTGLGSVRRRYSTHAATLPLKPRGRP